MNQAFKDRMSDNDEKVNSEGIQYRPEGELSSIQDESKDGLAGDDQTNSTTFNVSDREVMQDSSNPSGLFSNQDRDSGRCCRGCHPWRRG